jgi:hypothetical protein
MNAPLLYRFRKEPNQYIYTKSEKYYIFPVFRHSVFAGYPGHGLNDFGDGHPIVDFTGKPRVILGVPLIVSNIIPSNDLISFVVSNQHGFAILGHLVLGSYPGHGHGVIAN